MQRITIAEVEEIAFYLARKMFSFNEPIPDFSTRFPNILESCLETPFQTFGKKELYPTFIAKVGMLFYLMNKNHPFQNGNKRIATTTLFYFMHKNRKWLKVDNKELYNFAVWVAESNPRIKKETVQAVETFLSHYLVDLK